jgi:hypothetical protein
MVGSRTELARTEQGDVLYRSALGCFIAEAAGSVIRVSNADAVEALCAINAGQSMFDHWRLADDVERLCRIVGAAR